MAGNYKGRKPVEYPPLSRGHQAFLAISPGRAARALGVPTYRVAEWRKGKARPQADMLVKIEAAFQIDASWWDDPVPPEPVARVVERVLEQRGAPAAPMPLIPVERVLPEAPWDTEGAPPVIDPDELPDDAGIRGIMNAIRFLGRELDRTADPVQRARVLGQLVSANERLAKLQREKPVDEERDAGPGWLDCSHPWVRSLDYEHRALFQAVRSLLDWHQAHPDQIPPAEPAGVSRACIVDPLRGAHLGVLDPDRYVTLISPIDLLPEAVAAFVAAGWEPPVRRKDLYEHQE